MCALTSSRSSSSAPSLMSWDSAIRLAIAQCQMSTWLNVVELVSGRGVTHCNAPINTRSRVWTPTLNTVEAATIQGAGPPKTRTQKTAAVNVNAMTLPADALDIVLVLVPPPPSPGDGIATVHFLAPALGLRILAVTKGDTALYLRRLPEAILMQTRIGSATAKIRNTSGARKASPSTRAGAAVIVVKEGRERRRRRFVLWCC